MRSRHQGPVLLNRLIGEDAFKSVGGDPFIARRLGTLLLASGLERVEVVPGHSPALSSVGAVANFFSARLADVAFTSRVTRRGWIIEPVV